MKLILISIRIFARNLQIFNISHKARKFKYEMKHNTHMQSLQVTSMAVYS